MSVIEMSLWDAHEVTLEDNTIIIDTDSGLRVLIFLPREFRLPARHIVKGKFEDKIDATD